MSSERGGDRSEVARSVSSDVTCERAAAMKTNLLLSLLVGVYLQSACVADQGGPNLDAGFDAGDALDLTLLPNCTTKRIKVVYSSPETLALGDSTFLYAELLPAWWTPPAVDDASMPDDASMADDARMVDDASMADASTHDADPVVGDALASSVVTALNPVPFRLTWMLANDEGHTATGTLAEVWPCKPESISCIHFTCKGTGAKALDAGTETPVSGVWIVAKYEDETCFDTARVALRCSFALKP